jgi:hypothetical protein
MELSVGLSFQQQTKSGKSIPDGSISQSSFKLVIETKLHDKFPIEQLKGHLDSFENEQQKLLLGISPEKMNHVIEADFRTHLLSETNLKNLEFCTTTFAEIVGNFKSVISEYDHDLNALIDDYESYCFNENLITNINNRMMAIVSGTSFPENVEYGIYYCPEERNFSPFSLLGLYKDKAVRAIGKVSNHVKAEFQDGELQVSYYKEPITDKQRAALIGMMTAPKGNPTWDVTVNSQFFIVEKFHDTIFQKTTRYGLQGKKAFDLTEYNCDANTEDLAVIAEKLNHVDWDNNKL